MNIWDSCFLFLDNPRGGVEDFNYLKSKCPWVKGVFLNVHSHAPNEWSTVRTRANALGLFCGPWGRTMTPGSSPPAFDGNILDQIVRTADAWGAEPLIVNSEKELDGSGSTLTDYIAREVGSRQAAISMEAWPFSSVDWKPVAHLPVLPQIFPVESQAAKDPAVIKTEWHRRGVRCCYFTFGVYGGMKPGDFDLKAPYSLFPGDPIMASYGVEAWAPTSDGYVGCLPVSAPPSSAPSTSETRKVIADAAAAWEEGQPAPTPLTRITAARRIVESTDKQWRAVNQQVAKLLDDAGVVA